MRLSLALFISGILVVDAADPTRQSLQWQRGGNWRKRDGLASNSTQSLPANKAAPEVISSAPPGISDAPSSPAPSLFGPPQITERPIIISSGTGFPPIPLDTAGRDEPSILPIPVATTSSQSEEAEPSLDALPSNSTDALPSNSTDALPSNSTEAEPTSDPLPRPDLSNANPVPTNISTGQPGSSEEPAIQDEPSNSPLGFPFPTAGTLTASATDPGLWNVTATSSAEDSTITALPFPQLNVTDGQGLNDTGIKKNESTCGGCTVNAQANVDWWFPANVFQNLASISTITLNGSSAYTAVPLSTWTDVTAQLSIETFIYTEYMDPVESTLVGDYIFTTLPPPLAASTSFTTISAINPLPTTTFDIEELNSLNNYPDQPSIVVDPAVPAAISATQVDNIAWYTAYEVESDQEFTQNGGAVVCQRATTTYSLETPYAYTLPWDQSFGEAAVATGPVDTGFLDYIPQSSCTLGSWIAAPTMIVVVEITIQRGFNVFLVHHEVSDAGALDTPVDTLKVNVEPTKTPGVSVVPAIAHIESSDVTFLVTVTGNPASVTVPVGTGVVVASVVGGGTGNNNNPAPNNPAPNNPAPNNPAPNNPAPNSPPPANPGGGIASAIISALGGGTNTGGNANPAPAGGSTPNPVGNNNAGTVNVVPVPAAGAGSGVGSVNGIGFANPAPAGNAGTANVAVNAPAGNVGSGTNAAVPGSNVAVPGPNAAVAAVNAPAGNAGSGTNAAVPGSNAAVPGSNVAVPGSNAAIPGSNAGAGAGVPVITIGGQTFVGNQATEFLVAPGQTLTPGGVAIVGTNTVSLATNAGAIVINGQTTQLAPVAPAITPAPVINFQGQTITQNSAGAFVISGQSLVAGGTPITVGSNTISLGQGAQELTVNGVAITAPPALATPVISIDGTTFQAQGGGESFIIGGRTLTQGGSVVVGGNTISLSGAFAIVNGVSTVPISAIFVPPTVNVAGTAFTQQQGFFVIQGTTIRPGQTSVIAGTTVAFGTNGAFVVLNGVTTQLQQGQVSALVLSGTTYAATIGRAGFVIGGQTLVPGGVITANGHTISLSPNGVTMVVDGLTTLLQPIATLPPLITVDGKTYTANSGTTYNVNGQILTPGGCVTSGSKRICLASGATALVVDGTTTKLFPATKTPNAVSAVTTSSSARLNRPSGPSSSPVVAQTSTTSRSVASSISPINRDLTLLATLLSFLGVLFAWI